VVSFDKFNVDVSLGISSDFGKCQSCDLRPLVEGISNGSFDLFGSQIRAIVKNFVRQILKNENMICHFYLQAL